MTDEEIIAFRISVAELLNDPVRMEALSKGMEIITRELSEREEARIIEQRRWWDKHKHDTYY